MAYAGYLIRVGNYTIPKKYMRAEKYDVVLHGQDLDSYRDANGQLQRTALQHTVVDVIETSQKTALEAKEEPAEERKCIPMPDRLKEKLKL